MMKRPPIICFGPLLKRIRSIIESLSNLYHHVSVLGSHLEGGMENQGCPTIVDSL